MAIAGDKSPGPPAEPRPGFDNQGGDPGVAQAPAGGNSGRTTTDDNDFDLVWHDLGFCKGRRGRLF